jgi:hypothetical protein
MGFGAFKIFKFRTMRKFFLSLVLTMLAGCGPISPLFAGGPYKGKVVDAEIKAPIVEAVVLAVWYRGAPGLGVSSHGFLDAEEALTDKNGEFVIGEHPPASLIPGTWVDGPNTTIFYPNYGYFPRDQVTPRRPPGGYKELLAEMEKHAVVIELPLLKTKEEIEKSYLLVNPVEVPNEKKPMFIRLLNQQRKELGFKTFYPEK